MSLPSALDVSGVAVITGGASGLGLETAQRLVRDGMRVALLDVSVQELTAAETLLQGMAKGGKEAVLAVRCDVCDFEACKAAQAAVAAHFAAPISFLFNNAGIMGPQDGGYILNGNAAAWRPVFEVNVFGAMHILKAFLPSMIQAGPLPSGKQSLVVTTSSVVGLLNHGLGPYSVSKFAVTALCEQLAIELQGWRKAAHISPRTLHPTAASTNFFRSRLSDGQKTGGDDLFNFSKAKGMATASFIVDGLFDGLDKGLHYIVVDDPADIPTSEQISKRMEDQMSGHRPRPAEPLGRMLPNSDALKARMKLLEQRGSKL